MPKGYKTDSVLEASIVREYKKDKTTSLTSLTKKHGISMGAIRRMLVDANVPIRMRGATWSREAIPDRIEDCDGRYTEHRRKWRKPLLKKQGYRCAVCTAKLTVKTAHVDHCHSTGKIRGALCSNCNHGLGHFQDDVTNLKSAIAYLKAK